MSSVHRLVVIPFAVAALALTIFAGCSDDDHLVASGGAAGALEAGGDAGEAPVRGGAPAAGSAGTIGTAGTPDEPGGAAGAPVVASCEAGTSGPKCTP